MGFGWFRVWGLRLCGFRSWASDYAGLADQELSVLRVHGLSMQVRVAHRRMFRNCQVRSEFERDQLNLGATRLCPPTAPIDCRMPKAL